LIETIIFSHPIVFPMSLVVEVRKLPVESHMQLRYRKGKCCFEMTRETWRIYRQEFSFFLYRCIFSNATFWRYILLILFFFISLNRKKIFVRCCFIEYVYKKEKPEVFYASPDSCNTETFCQWHHDSSTFSLAMNMFNMQIDLIFDDISSE
jgi:hypothetical protein